MEHKFMRVNSMVIPEAVEDDVIDLEDDIQWFRAKGINFGQETEQEQKESIETTIYLLRHGYITLDRVPPKNREYFKNIVNDINKRIAKTEAEKKKRKKNKKNKKKRKKHK